MLLPASTAMCIPLSVHVQRQSSLYTHGIVFEVCKKKPERVVSMMKSVTESLTSVGIKFGKPYMECLFVNRQRPASNPRCK